MALVTAAEPRFPHLSSYDDDPARGRPTIGQRRERQHIQFPSRCGATCRWRIMPTTRDIIYYSVEYKIDI